MDGAFLLRRSRLDALSVCERVLVLLRFVFEHVLMGASMCASVPRYVCLF